MLLTARRASKTRAKGKKKRAKQKNKEKRLSNSCPIKKYISRR